MDPSAIRSPRSLGSALRRARTAAGLTQLQLGQRTSLRQATISSLERGDGATLDTLFAVMTYLKLDLLLTPRRDTDIDLDDLF